MPSILYFAQRFRFRDLAKKLQEHRLRVVPMAVAERALVKAGLQEFVSNGMVHAADSAFNQRLEAFKI